MLKPSPDLIARHLETLVDKIGIRLAGSDAEKAAGQYAAQEFHKHGAEPDMETFPVRQRMIESEELEIKTGTQKSVFPCSLLGASPVPEKAAAAPLVFFYGEVDYQRKDLSFLKDKAVVHIGCHIKSRENYRRLIAAKPAFLIFTDIRYPGGTPTADGLFPSYVQDIGAVPSVCVAYHDAWNWLKESAATAKLIIKGKVQPGVSLNAIGNVPGSDPEAGIIFTGSHLDSQASTPGADDNASGVAFQLELARVLAPLKLKHTVRHIAFGAEEQLSVGSASYVRKHRVEIEKYGRFMFNADSCGSRLGWTAVNYNGPKNIETLLAPELQKLDLYANYTTDAIPFTDQFPFVMCGVPGLWLYRPNCASGQWYHHRAENNLEVISPEILASYVEAAANFIVKISRADKFPIRRMIPPSQMKQFNHAWNDFFGGW